MTRFLLLLLILQCSVWANTIHAQLNLVPNGDFEYYTTCPTGLSRITYCIGWRQWTLGTPDYFSNCASLGGAGIPSNPLGFQYAASGNAYVGGHSDSTAVPYKEYITRPILAMQVGAAYEVSLSVSVANYSGYGTNDVGIYFYDKAPSFYSTNTIPTGITPQVEWPSSVITDTQNWTRLTKVFIADSTYDNIVIGGFRKRSNITTGLAGTLLNRCYYYYDSVVVKRVKLLELVFPNSKLCVGDTINVPYDVNNTLNVFQSNNVFTLQLSNASGSFTSPVNIGTKSSNSSNTIIGVIPSSTPIGTGYRIRMVSSNRQDTTYDNGSDIAIGNLPAKPVANNNGPLCNSDTLLLTASSTTQGVSYKWTGPNSFASVIQNPSIPNPVSANSGSYIVTAYVYGCESKDTTSVFIYGGNGPLSTLANSNSPICAGDTLKLFGTANGINNTYTWTGPNSFSSNAQFPEILNVSATQSGSYVLHATDGTCMSIDTINVLVKPHPANLTISSNSPLCAGATINLSASSTSTGVNYIWSGPNAFSSTSASTFIAGASSGNVGNYYVTASLNGCSLSDTLPVILKPLPGKPVANSNSAICVGETLNLTSASTTTGVSYSWTGPGSYTSIVQSPSISGSTTSMSGSYVVAVAWNGCIAKDTTMVLVKPMPIPVTASNNSPVCEGDTLLLSMGTSSGGSTYSWSGPYGFTANAQIASVRANANASGGWYVATVDLNGCTIKDSTQAIIKPMPATPPISYNSPLCLGETLQLSAGTISGVNYIWTGANNFTSNLQNTSRTNMQFSDTGTYKLIATLNGCVSNPNTLLVKINPLPYVVISATPVGSILTGDSVLLKAQPNNYSGTPQYKWYVNGLPSGGVSRTYGSSLFKDGDVIRCDMTETNQCDTAYTTSSNDIVVQVASGINITSGINDKISVYPNPANEYVIFDCGNMPNTKDKLTVDIYNVFGQKVSNIEMNARIARWQIGNAAAGVYIYQLKTNSTTIATGRISVTK